MMILAPLRGVTIRAFREAFALPIKEAGFTEAFTPFIPAMPGLDPLKDRELQTSTLYTLTSTLKVTPQFIGKDPTSFRVCLKKIKDAGYDTADLNCGCPFSMVRNKGRGSGILRTPDVLRKMMEVGCEEMGDKKFSIKTRIGIERTDELERLIPLINEFPLRFLTVHSRTAKQMYEGECHHEVLNRIKAICRVPLIENGDLDYRRGEGMVGRSFIRALGERDDIEELLKKYMEISEAELFGDRPVLGRLKELLAYFKDSPTWSRRWQIIKLCRSVEELYAGIA